jgi:hypothetical protein
MLFRVKGVVTPRRIPGLFQDPKSRIRDLGYHPKSGHNAQFRLFRRSHGSWFFSTGLSGREILDRLRAKRCEGAALTNTLKLGEVIRAQISRAV